MIGPARYWALISGVLFALVTCCVLIAGLWPFGHPRNDVSWIEGRNGVHFGRPATLQSVGSLPDRDSGACTIEMWLQPDLRDSSSTLLAFYDDSGAVGLSLHQSLSDLRVDLATSHWRPAKMYVDDLFRPSQQIFVTVVSGTSGTAVYVNGVLVRRSNGFRPTGKVCSGAIVVGDSPGADDTWPGTLTGLAIHQYAFTPEQAAANYLAWGNTGRSGRQPDALYLFNERSGRSIRDQGTAGVNLSIPERYMIARPTLLNLPWIAYDDGGSYWEDILINVGGFMPFGFTLNAFLSLRWRTNKAGTIAVLAGLLVSLTIEVLQSLLPTRNSDLTDVLTNTLGAWLGVALYREWTRRFGATPTA